MSLIVSKEMMLCKLFVCVMQGLPPHAITLMLPRSLCHAHSVNQKHQWGPFATSPSRTEAFCPSVNLVKRTCSSTMTGVKFILQCLMKNMKIEKVWNGSDIHYVRKMARAGQKDRNIIDCVFFGFFVISGD